MNAAFYNELLAFWMGIGERGGVVGGVVFRHVVWVPGGRKGRAGEVYNPAKMVISHAGPCVSHDAGSSSGRHSCSSAELL